MPLIFHSLFRISQACFLGSFFFTWKIFFITRKNLNFFCGIVNILSFASHLRWLLQIICFLQLLKNIKMIFSLWAIPKETIGQIWLLGHSLPAPALEDRLMKLYWCQPLVLVFMKIPLKQLHSWSTSLLWLQFNRFSYHFEDISLTSCICFS